MEKMMDDLERLDASIEQTKARLAEMEIAARVLRELRLTSNGKHGGRPHSRAEHSAGAVYVAKTIAVHAREILAGAGAGGMHFKAIADAAIDRGYKGRKSANAKSIRQAFWATMSRNKDVFKPLGGGKFALT